MSEIWLNNKSLADFGIFVDSSETFSTAARDIEKISVPGRTGDLTYTNNRMANESLVYNCFARDNLRERYAALMTYLLSQEGYIRLEDDQHLDEFRNVLFYEPTHVKTGPWNRNGLFSLTFDADPRHFLKKDEAGIVWRESGGDIEGSSFVLHNPGMRSEPLLWLANSSGGQITIGDVTMTTLSYAPPGAHSSVYPVAYIDCETKNAYSDRDYGVLANDFLEGLDFFTLPPGETIVTLENYRSTSGPGRAELVIYPRWWRPA